MTPILLPDSQDPSRRVRRASRRLALRSLVMGVVLSLLATTAVSPAQAPGNGPEGTPVAAPDKPAGPPPLDEAEAGISAADLLEHLRFLAADEQKGRATGSEEAAKVATYIAEHMKKHGLRPAGEAQGYEAKFAVPGRVCRNVCGVVPGTDGRLKSEYLVFGAHFDHVGIGAFGSRDPKRRGEVHNGADDNASGTSGLLELVQAVAAKPFKRSVLFLAFSGEEMGLLGSKAWCQKPTVPLERLVAMINLDMIGRSKDKYVFVGGLNTGTGLDKIARDVGQPFGMKFEWNGGGRGPSDHDSFYAEKIPVLFFFTNEHDQYHTPDDDVDLINTADEAAIVRMAYRIGRRLAEGPRPKFLKDDRQSMPISSSRPVDQAKTLLGIAIAAAGAEADGVAVIATDASGTAKKAGLLVEDRIVMIDDAKIATVRDVQEVLGWKRPGTNVKLQVVRGRAKKRVTITVPLKD